MKLKYGILWALLPLILGFSACKDTVDLTADYKDISIAYSILNPHDSVHYFKIYKGFLTDDNALTAATDWNNIYYSVDSIEVRLEEYKNGSRVRAAILDTTTAINKESGSFANPKQLLYYSTWTLDAEASYRLVIKHTNSGKEVYAETLLVGDFTISRPNSSWNLNYENAYNIKFSGAENAAAYDLYLKFYYIEVNNTTGQIEHKVLTKKLNSDILRLSGNDLSYSGFIPKSIFTYIANNIAVNDKVTRYIDAINEQPYYCMDLQIWAANDVYLTYRDVATPSSSIVQDRLEYTNFISDNANAYGFLASRNYSHRNLKMDISQNHNEDTLVGGAATKKLHFDYYRNSPLFLEDHGQ